MRFLPFAKGKKGFQFAGGGVSDSGGGGGGYVLQPATSSTLGGVKIGSGIDVTSDGTISAGVDYTITSTEIKTNFKYGNNDVFVCEYILPNSVNVTSSNVSIDIDMSGKKIFDVKMYASNNMLLCAYYGITSSNKLNVMLPGQDSFTVNRFVVYYTKTS